jgi:hypothetical protein
MRKKQRSMCTDGVHTTILYYDARPVSSHPLVSPLPRTTPSISQRQSQSVVPASLKRISHSPLSNASVSPFHVRQFQTPDMTPAPELVLCTLPRHPISHIPSSLAVPGSLYICTVQYIHPVHTPSPYTQFIHPVHTPSPYTQFIHPVHTPHT